MYVYMILFIRRYYAEYFAEELEVVEHLKKKDYTSLPELLRWRALDWLCSSVSEREDGSVRTELERRMMAGRVLEKLQDQLRPQLLLQLTPELRAVAAALNAVLVEDAKSYGWFSAPVEAQKLGLTNYHDIVKTPMDLGTVLSNLMKIPSVYEGPNAAMRDVRQVWLNSRSFNGRMSPVTKAAEHLEALFDSTLASARSEVGEEGGTECVETVMAPEMVRGAEVRERAAAVRSEPVGVDRLGRSYYWDGSTLLVENTSALVDLEVLCQYHTASDFSQLLHFLDDTTPDDRRLKRWLRSHKSFFEPDAAVRQDAVGSWVSERAAVPPEDVSVAQHAEFVLSTLRQEGLVLHDSVLLVPMSLRVRKTLYSFRRHCQTMNSCANSLASLKETSLAVEEALTQVDALSPAWAEASLQWRHDTANAHTAAALGLQLFVVREEGFHTITALSEREITRAQFIKGTRKGRLFVPMPLQEVAYLSRGHLQHFER